MDMVKTLLDASAGQAMGNPEPSLSLRGRCNDLTGVDSAAGAVFKIKSTPA